MDILHIIPDIRVDRLVSRRPPLTITLEIKSFVKMRRTSTARWHYDGSNKPLPKYIHPNCLHTELQLTHEESKGRKK